MRVYTYIIALFYFLQLFSGNAVAQDGRAFIHTANDENTNVTITTIENPLTDFQADARLFITLASRHKRPAPDNTDIPLVPAVQYEDGRWRIVNQAGAPILPGTKFNILVMPRNHPDVFFHINKNRAQIQIYTGRSHTILRNSRLDREPGAATIATPVLGSQGRTLCPWVTSPIATRYKNDSWQLYKIDGSQMPRDACFNILVSPNAKKITINNVSSYVILRNDGPDSVSNNSDNRVFVTRSGETLPPGMETFVSRSPQNWFVWKQPRTNWKAGEELSILTSYDLKNDGSYRLYAFDGYSWSMSRYYGEPIEFPTEIEGAEILEVSDLNYDENGELNIETGGDEVADVVIQEDLDGVTVLSKFLKTKHGQNIGTFSVADNFQIVVRLDYNLDGVVDHLAYHDTASGHSFFLVRENLEALDNFRLLQEQRNPFCGIDEVTDGASNSLTGYGESLDQRASILGCTSEGGVGGFGVGGEIPSNDATSLGRDEIDSFTENRCLAVVSNSPTPHPGESLVSGWRERRLSGRGLVFTGLFALVGGGATLLSGGAAAPAVAAAWVAVVGGGVAIPLGARTIAESERDEAIEAEANRLRDLADRVANERRRIEQARDRARADGNDDEAERLQREANERRRREERLKQEADRRQREAGSGEPIPGEEQFDEAEWCQDYLTRLYGWRQLHSLDSLEKQRSELKCNNPAEIAASRTAAFSTVGGNIENIVYCPNRAAIDSFVDLEREFCNDPRAEPDDSGRCPTNSVGSTALRSGRSNLELETPIDELEQRIDDQIVNPGDRLNRN